MRFATASSYDERASHIGWAIFRASNSELYATEASKRAFPQRVDANAFAAREIPEKPEGFPAHSSANGTHDAETGPRLGSEQLTPLCAHQGEEDDDGCNPESTYARPSPPGMVCPSASEALRAIPGLSSHHTHSGIDPTRWPPRICLSWADILSCVVT